MQTLSSQYDIIYFAYQAVEIFESQYVFEAKSARNIACNATSILFHATFKPDQSSANPDPQRDQANANLIGYIIRSPPNATAY
jgi:hypothetical protein